MFTQYAHNDAVGPVTFVLQLAKVKYFKGTFNLTYTMNTLTLLYSISLCMFLLLTQLFI